MYKSNPIRANLLIYPLSDRGEKIENSIYTRKESDSEKDFFLQKANGFIYRNIDNENFDSVHLSQDMGISRSQLFRKIKEFSSFSTALYIRHIRLEKSQELLQGDLPIRIIAYAVGFKDVGYFSRCFKKAYKLSPSKYRSETLIATHLIV